MPDQPITPRSQANVTPESGEEEKISKAIWNSGLDECLLNLILEHQRAEGVAKKIQETSMVDFRGEIQQSNQEII